ncbi:serine/threonine protein kinase [Deinococcus irradiatisoli]|uniref:Serine/threonine protein kinase n=1 Tax=Deinococcus irradiatisoli TaxID=2202254 RepID=A0A2Z3JBT5_9DEIO|nr:serine/threonine-protein kinase [Deinococcus irradiatisoli]AWN22435.1 serine/threonine protein kinase [Deinococcus irradiatisoli]
MSLAGTRVAGHYTLMRPLGQGASSLVYLALGDDGQPYTVKLFSAGLLDHAEREARMRVRGPHLAEVMALSEVAGHPAVVLRFTKGTEMFQRYRLRPALRHEPGAYLWTLSDVLTALNAMHSAGMLHRDVKADNILVLRSGEAQLLDYDLSGPIHEEFAVPQRIGTAAFQSPEAGRGAVLGPESDLYGVGVLLYWGLYGVLPDLDGQTDSAELFAGDLPASERALAELCRRLLEPDPHRRPQHAGQVRAELWAARSGLRLD